MLALLQRYMINSTDDRRVRCKKALAVMPLTNLESLCYSYARDAMPYGRYAGAFDFMISASTMLQGHLSPRCRASLFLRVAFCYSKGV